MMHAISIYMYLNLMLSFNCILYSFWFLLFRVECILLYTAIYTIVMEYGYIYNCSGIEWNEVDLPDRTVQISEGKFWAHGMLYVSFSRRA